MTGSGDAKGRGGGAVEEELTVMQVGSDLWKGMYKNEPLGCDLHQDLLYTARI